MTPRKEHEYIKSAIYGLVLVLIIMVGIPALQQCNADRITAAWQIGYDAGLEAGLALRPLPTIEEIQHQIGCEKIDGIWGPETDKLYDKALCNQYAIEVFEEALADAKEKE